MSRVIIVTGVSCTGKSTLVNRFCEEAKELYYRISLDDFYNMLPLNNRSVIEDDYIYQTNRLMWYVVRYLISERKNVIVDTILLYKEEHKNILKEIESVLGNQELLLVKLKCSIEELKERAKNRGDRDFNLIQRQVAMSFDDSYFDVVLDSSGDTINENVRKLIVKNDDSISFNQISRLLKLIEVEE